MKALTDAELLGALKLYAPRCLDHFGSNEYWTILATGSDEQLQRWAMDFWPDFFDRRKQTARCRVWNLPDEPVEAAMMRCVESAKRFDVTIQLLCTHDVDQSTKQVRDLGGVFVEIADMRETYPILCLGSHGQKWGDA